MTVDVTKIRDILERIAATHPKYRVKSGVPYYLRGREAYLFSSHHFISHYRARNPEAYADLLDRCRHSRVGQDRSAHAQIASCLGRYAKYRDEIRPIGRRINKDVHDNNVRPMWWVWRRR